MGDRGDKTIGRYFMKILACCSGGIVRSAGLKAALFVNGLEGRDVLTLGLRTNSEGTKNILFEWADIICVCGESALIESIPERYRAKTRHYDVGNDVYGSPNHWSLINQFQQILKEQPL